MSIKNLLSPNDLDLYCANITTAGGVVPEYLPDCVSTVNSGASANNVLTFNGSTAKWVPAAPSSGTTIPNTTGVTHSVAGSSSPTVTNSLIVNADVSSSAAIADTKLATISTAGKVANSATTATSLTVGNSIVLRDVSGNFSCFQLNADAVLTNALTSPNVPDCDFGTPPTNTQVLSYNSGSGKWIPGNSGGGLTPSYGYFTLLYGSSPTSVSILPLDTVQVKSSDYSLNAGTGEVTVTNTGVYLVTIYCTFYTVSNFTPANNLGINGSTTVNQFINNSVSSGYAGVSGTCIVSLNASDILTIIATDPSSVINNTGNALTAYLSINRLA